MSTGPAPGRRLLARRAPGVGPPALPSRPAGLLRLAAGRPLGGALLAREPAPEPWGRPAPAPGGPLCVAAAGCRLLLAAVTETARAYAGLGALTVHGCEIDPADPEAHIEEPPGAVPAGTRRPGPTPDAILLPPASRRRPAGPPRSAVVSIELAPDCILHVVEQERRSRPVGPTTLLLAGDLVTRLLVAALAERAPEVTVLAYTGLEHLRGHLRTLARLRPGSVLAEPAAAELARRAGLPARSLYDGPGRCLVVHALERALAAACLRRFAHLRHGPSASVAGEAAAHLPSRATRPPEEPADPARDVVALRAARRRFVLVPAATISYVSSRGGLVTALADAGTFWTDATLGELEARLDPRRFLRLDASRIVNLARVTELVPWTRQRYVLRLADAGRTELFLSRDVGRRLRATLGW